MSRAQIEKNLRILLYSRTSAIILLLGPLLLVALAGLSLYSSSDMQLTIGLITTTDDVRIDALQNQLEQRFIVIPFTSNETCIIRMYSGTVQSCIQADNQRTNRISVKVYIDPSQVSTAESVAASLTSAINNQSAALSTTLTQTLLGRVSNVTEELQIIKRETLPTLTNYTSQSSTSIDAGTEDITAIQALDNGFQEVASSAAIQTARNDLDETIGLFFDAIDEAKDTLTDARASAPDVVTRRTLDEGLATLSDLEHEINTYIQSPFDSTWAGVDLDRYARALQDQTIQLAVQIRQAGSKGISANQQLTAALNNVEAIAQTTNKLAQKVNSSLVQLQGASSVSAGEVVSPYVVDQVAVAESPSRLFFLIPGLLVTLILLSSIAIATTSVQLEKKTPAKFRNFAAPVSNVSTFIALQITVLFVVFLQILIVLTAVYFLYGGLSITAIFSTLFVLLITALCFTTIGMINGYLFSTEQNAIIGALTISGILLFFSDALVAIEVFPAQLQQIIQWSPFVIASELVREVLILNATPSYGKIIALGVYFFASTLVVFGAMKAYRVLSLIYMQKITKHFK